MNKKYTITLVSLTLLLVVSILLGTSYSVWKTKYTQVGTNSIDVGCFSVTYTSLSTYGGQEAGDINLVNAYPITETAGSALTPYVFTIENTCSIAANYVINLETLNTSTFNTDYLRVKFNEVSNNSNTSVLYKDIEDGTSLLSGNAIQTKQLVLGYLTPSQSITYSLRTWIDINATTETENVMGRSWNGKVTVESAAFKPAYEIVSGDLDTVGSEVKIGTEEFYVMGQEDLTHVKLLSKWNLNVGNNPKGTATGLQDSDVRGLRSDGTKYGNVAFSSTNYWYDGSALKPAYGSSYPAYVYDNNASIKTYVDTYVTYLTNQGVNVSGRLISHEELVSLGCNASTNYCDSNGTHGGTAPNWVYQTSYWSGSANDGNFVWRVSLGGGFNYSIYGSDGSNYGVRPVIILEK